jgi:hypothetical protein
MPDTAPGTTPDASNLNETIEAGLRMRRAALVLEHRDLDDTVSLLGENEACDELLLSRLKKRRLHLRDEIARIDGYFAPRSIAS